MGGSRFEIYFRKVWEEITAENIRMRVIHDSKTLVSNLQSTSGVLDRKLRIDIASIKTMMVNMETEEIEWVNKTKQLADVFMKLGVRSEEILTYVTGKREG